MYIDINSENGPAGKCKNVDSKIQTDSATEISKSNCESMKVVQDKFENISTFLSGLTLDSSQQNLFSIRLRFMLHVVILTY